MMMAPGDVSGLASKIAEPFTFGPEMSGEEKTLLGLVLLTGIPISELRRQYAEGNYAGMAGTALPAIALTALGGYGMRRKGVPRPTPEVPTQLVQDILRAQRFLKKPVPTIRGLLPERSETKLPEPTNLRDIIIPTEGAIPEPKIPVWIGGPSGTEGMVVPPSIKADPRTLARVAGQLFPEEATPSGTAVNLDELREMNRLRSIFYGPGEQEGLGSLQIHDRPTVNIPPVAGETSLGFNPRTQAELPYPLNVVPERLHPRAAQTEIAKATPEAIREPAQAPYVNQEVFLDASLPGEPKPPSRGFIEKVEAYSGEGTARPGEPQRPSAPPKPRRISPAVEAKEVISEIKKSPEPTVKAIAFKEPVKQEFKSRMTTKTLDVGRRVVKGFSKSKWNWEAGETTIAKQGLAGKRRVS